MTLSSTARLALAALLLAAPGAALAQPAQRQVRERPMPAADSARASRPEPAPRPPAGIAERSPLARRAALDSARADSTRRASGDTLAPRRALPANLGLAAADSADAARAAADSARGAEATGERAELVQWVEPDSVMAALLARSGYAVTRYQGRTVTFEPTSRQITLDGGPAAVQQGEAVVVGDSIVYDDQRRRIELRADSGGSVVLRDPAQGEDVIAGGLTYDLNTRSGVVRNIATAVESGERWYVSADRAGLVGEQPGDDRTRFYGHSGTITSCDLTEPHYHFEARNMKVVQGSIMVARPAILYIGNVPVLWLPFVLQDMREGRRSGLLSPRLGIAELVRNGPFYRRSVENVGYYFALSDYADASVWLDWRSGARASDADPGFMRYNGELQYRWIDRFLSGRFGTGIERWGDGRRNFQLSWNHQQQFSQRTSFNSSINYAQNTQLQRLGAFVPQAALATIRSQAAFQTRRGPFSLSLGGNQTQYTGQERVERTLPTLNLTSEPLSVGEWLVWTPALSVSNAQSLNNPVLGELQARPRLDPVTGSVVIDTAQFDRRTTNIGFQTPLRIFDFNWNNSFQITDVDASSPVRATVYGPGGAGDSTVRVFAREFRTEVNWSTGFSLPQFFAGSWNLTPSVNLGNVAGGPFAVRGFLSNGEWVRQTQRLTYSLGVSPTLYRRFPGFGPFEAIRHAITPQISYNYAPRADVNGRFLQAIGQNPATFVGGLASSAVQLTLNTTIEAKLRSDDDSAAAGDAGQGATANKVRLLSLDFTQLAYDFIRADTLGRGLTNEGFGISGRSDLLPGFNFRVQYSLFNGPSSDINSEFKPYRTGIDASFSIGRNSDALALLSRIFGRAVPGGDPRLDSVEPTAEDDAARRMQELPVAGARARIPVPQVPIGQGWQSSVSFSSQRFRPDLRGTVVDYDPALQCESLVAQPVSYERCVDYARRNPPATDGLPSQGGVIVRTPAVTSLSWQTTFDLTRKWGASWNSSYDFQRGDFADHSVSLQRDLHDWRATFAINQAANGNFAFTFFIALKAQPDIKFDYRQQSFRGAAGQF